MWQVHFTFKGSKLISQPFSYKKYGGKETALLWAKRFRDAIEHELAASQIGYGKFGKVLTDPDHGITQSVDMRVTKNGIRLHPYWAATWPGAFTKAVNRKFYFKKCGGEKFAKLAAIEARRKGYEEYLEALQTGRVPRIKNLNADEECAHHTPFSCRLIILTCGFGDTWILPSLSLC